MSKYTHFEALPLHATFGAELKGIDWPHINADVVAEIKAAVDEVQGSLPSFGKKKAQKAAQSLLKRRTKKKKKKFHLSLTLLLPLVRRLRAPQHRPR